MIKYLFNKGHKNPCLLDDAFVSAAIHGHTDIVAYLLGSELISSKKFDSAFVDAAGSGVAATCRFLYEQHRVSRPALGRVFEILNY